MRGAETARKTWTAGGGPAGDFLARPAFSHARPGTPEGAWREWLDSRTLPPLSLAGVRRLLVVAAHPDDETLGAGGLLATASSLGIEATVLLLTDGERADGAPSAELGRERRGEFDRAMAVLGQGQVIETLALQFPDGEVRANADRLEIVLSRLVDGFDLCAGPFEGDGHPDHDAAGAVSRRVSFLRGVPYCGFPVWLWHWSSPGAGSPVASARRFTLSADAHDLKARALAAYASQRRGTSPILSSAVLDHFQREFEVFIP